MGSTWYEDLIEKCNHDDKAGVLTNGSMSGSSHVRFKPCQVQAMLRFLLNAIWFVLGGFVMGLGWWLAGLVAAITVVGLPWARACFVIGNFSFWPFGYEAISRSELTGRTDLGTGPLGLVGNVIWFLLAGWWLAIGHVTSALACFVTIIGIPFGIQHIKLALIALAPIGLQVVPSGTRPQGVG